MGRLGGKASEGELKRKAGREGGKTKVPKGFANPTRSGDRILVLKQKWLSLLLSGRKTLEIRGTRLKPGRCLIGCGGKIYASAVLGKAIEIKTVRQWRELRGKHLVDTNVLPYVKTWGLPVYQVELFKKIISYTHTKGAIGVVKMRK